MNGRGPERGSISIVIACGSAVMMMLGLAAADLGSMLVTRARAQAAADAAALAAVVQQAPILGRGEDPEGAARDVAERNRVTLLSCECVVGSTETTVEVEAIPRLTFLEGWFGRRVHARARAQLDADVFSYRESG